MGIDEAELRRRARRAYHRGRARVACTAALGAVPPAVISAHLSQGWVLALILGTALAGVLGWSTWLGGAWRRGVWPGLWAGACGGGAMVGLLLCGVCGADDAWLCHLLCPAAGVLAGGLVGLRAAREQGARRTFLLSAGITAGLTGALGCALVGILGVAGLLAGVALSAAPMALLADARS